MLNQVVIVGRLTQDPKIEELEENEKGCTITLAVPRAYKNAEGVYDTDFIKCELWNEIAKHTAEYLRKGDLLGIKGRLQTTITETENGERKYTMNVVAEKVSFLGSRKNESEEE